jgi:hypothetical protein
MNMESTSSEIEERYLRHLQVFQYTTSTIFLHELHEMLRHGFPSAARANLRSVVSARRLRRRLGLHLAGRI